MNQTSQSAIALAKRWRPSGRRLMEHLSMRAKLALMGTMLLVPLVVLSAMFFRGLYSEYEIARDEADGIVAVGGLLEVVTHLHGVSLPDARSRDLAQAVGEVTAVAARQPGLDMQARWRDLAPRIQAAASTAQKAEVVDDIRRLAVYVGETSGLLFDPQAATFFMMDLSVERVIGWIAQIASARDAVGHALERAGTDPQALTLARERVRAVAETSAIVADRVEALERAGEKPVASWADARDAVTALTRQAQAALAGGDTGGAMAATLPALASRAMASAVVFDRDNARRLEELLRERASQRLAVLGVLATLSTAALLVTLWLMALIVKTTTSRMDELLEAMRAGGRGDLSRPITLRGNDELGHMAREFDKMLRILSSLVADVRSASSMVSYVGGQLVEDAMSLSGRTQAQAVSLEEATSNVAKVSSAISSNSDSAANASAMAGELQRDAERAQGVMTQTMAHMDPLRDSAARMSEIIATIDGIAFQTNILALNAAVEAARAGEQGRGFAVVAAEVRNLSQRTQQASAEVRGLIETSSGQIGQTVEEIGRVNQTMADLVQGIREVSASVSEIAHAGSAQSSALAEVVNAVGDIDRVTSENAALVDRTSHRSRRLSQRSQQLQEAVAHIHVREGTADQAMALVQAAARHLKAVGLERASQDFHDPQAGFIDRDLYIFMLDRKGHYRVMGADRQKVGWHVSQMPGVDAQRLIEDCWYRADRGGGWVEYNISNPVNGEVRGKSSFVLPFGQDLLVGCGAYRNVVKDPANVLAPAQAAPADAAPGAQQAGSTREPSPRAVPALSAA